MTSPTWSCQAPITWWHPMTLVFMAVFASGCSIQKRTALPGFHIERMHKSSQDAEWNSPSSRNVEKVTSLGCSPTPPTTPQRWIRVGTGLDAHPPLDMAWMPRGLPRRVAVNPGERELLEPQPSEKEAKSQRLFGLVSLTSFCLGVILLAMGTPHPLPFMLAMVALLMKKIQANKVLDIMNAHGEDGGKTGREQRKEQRRESKNVRHVVLKTALLTISGVALVLAIAEYLSGSWW